MKRNEEKYTETRYDRTHSCEGKLNRSKMLEFREVGCGSKDQTRGERDNRSGSDEIKVESMIERW